MSKGRTGSSHPFTDIFGLFTDGFRIGDGVVCDGWEKFLLILSIERRLPHQHLVEEDSVGPPVHTGAVGLVVDDLGRDVVRSPTERLRHRAVSDPFLAHPKVGYLDVALLVEHDVVQLEVPVDDTVRVEIHYSDENLCSVEPANIRSYFLEPRPEEMRELTRPPAPWTCRPAGSGTSGRRRWRTPSQSTAGPAERNMSRQFQWFTGGINHFPWL